MQTAKLMFGPQCPPIFLEPKDPLVPDAVAQVVGLEFRQITHKGEPKYELQTIEAVTAYEPLLGALYTAVPSDFVSTEPLNKFLADMPDLIKKFTEEMKWQREQRARLVEAAPPGVSADEVAAAADATNKLVVTA